MGELDRNSKGESNGSGDDEKRRGLIRTVCMIIAVVFTIATLACVVVFAILRLDIMFIPIALCAIIAMISFTYARVKS